MNIRNIKRALIAMAVAAAGATANGQSMRPYYEVETVEHPDGLNPEVGGLTLAPDGRIAACFQSGEVYLIDAESNQWKLFAEGLFAAERKQPLPRFPQRIGLVTSPSGAAGAAAEA